MTTCSPYHAVLAAKNKCLAGSNKSRTGVPATNKRPAARRNPPGAAKLARPRCGVSAAGLHHPLAARVEWKLNMSWHHPDLYFFLCLLAGLAAFLAVIYATAPKYLKKANPLDGLRRDRQGDAADAQSEREFRAVFGMTSQAGKEAMIERWMRRQGCSRSEAMRLAVEEWRRDNR